MRMDLKFAIRIDDICPTMNLQYFNEFVCLMDRYGIKPLLGIIPDNKDPEQMIDTPNDSFWENIMELQHKGYSIAMHGYNHVYDIDNAKTVVCGKKHSEFAGHSYEEQFRRIEKGKKCLAAHGIYTDIFFAPGHSYDKNTLKALYDNGFKYVSDGLSLLPYIEERVICIPCRSFGVPLRIQKQGIVMAVCHTNEWATAKGAKEKDKLYNFCEKFHSSILPFSEIEKIAPSNILIQKMHEKVFYCLRCAKNKIR